jgi:hypothetical protein
MKTSRAAQARGDETPWSVVRCSLPRMWEADPEETRHPDRTDEIAVEREL